MSRSYVIPSYDLPAPRVSDFRATVRRVVGREFEATWARLCAEAGVPATSASMTLAQLDDLATALTGSPGVLGVMGRSLAVRLSTYRTLSHLNGAHHP